MKMAKRIFGFIMALALCVSLLPAALADAATSGTCGDNLTWSLENGVLTISGTGAMTDYDYSENRAPWSSVGDSITSVKIEDGVTSIGNVAFPYCTSLNSVTISDSVTSIGDHAFEDCSSLTSVTIPDGVTSIGDGAFYVCTGLTSVTIPDSVTSIGAAAFSRCESLINVTLGDGVTSIGSCAFCLCTGLTSVTIPASVTSIDTYAFGQPDEHNGGGREPELQQCRRRPIQ